MSARIRIDVIGSDVPLAPTSRAGGERSTCERSSCDAKQVGQGGDPTSSDSRQRPLTRIPSLRLRFARNPTSPHKRGEVELAARPSLWNRDTKPPPEQS